MMFSRILLLLLAVAPVVAASLDLQPTTSATATQVDPANDPCENGAQYTLLKRLGVMTEDGGYPDNVFTACQYLPFDEYTALVAVMQPSKTPGRFEQQGELDLHILQINNDADVFVEGYFPGAGETGGYTLSGITFDLSLSGITSKLGGFAILSGNSSHCGACDADIGQDDYSLFVLSEKSIDWVLKRHTVATEETDRAANAANCVNAGKASNTEMKLGNARHHGLLDLIFTTTRKQVPGMQLEPLADCTATEPPVVTQQTWQFDGREYRPVAAKP